MNRVVFVDERDIIACCKVVPLVETSRRSLTVSSSILCDGFFEGFALSSEFVVPRSFGRLDEVVDRMRLSWRGRIRGESRRGRRIREFGGINEKSSFVVVLESPERIWTPFQPRE